MGGPWALLGTLRRKGFKKKRKGEWVPALGPDAKESKLAKLPNQPVKKTLYFRIPEP